MTFAGGFRPALMRWYRQHGRHALPWRLTRDPYAVLVSEVMLQQTQVDRVLPYYERWLSRWPTVEDLATATSAEAIREWSGLGYNRRALYLHRTAVVLVEGHAARFPTDLTTLGSLPGVGPYTTAAIAAFAHESRVAVVDTNIARVLARAVLGVASQRHHPPAALLSAANDLLPTRNARDHNLALMDLGAMVCTARSPHCVECPMRRHCAWYAAGTPALPASNSNPAAPFESTSRYARGRIIDALRHESCLDESSLLALLPVHHRANLTVYLKALAHDGLIRQNPDGWSLP